MNAAEVKKHVDDAVSVLIEAADTEDALWAARMTGQDSEQAEASGYLYGYRDALAAVQRLVGHYDPTTLDSYVESLRDEIREWETELEELEEVPS